MRRLDNSLRPDEQAGSDVFFNRDPILIRNSTCNKCHELDREAGHFGTSGKHDGLISVKIPHLRNLYQKVGMFGIPTHWLLRDQGGSDFGPQVRGYGFMHGGSMDTARRATGTLAFNLPLAEDRQNVEAFLMAFDSNLAPIVGQQVTIDADSSDSALARLQLLVERAETGFHWPEPSDGHECELIASAVGPEGPRTWLLRDGAFRPDRSVESQLTLEELIATIPDGFAEMTFTCGPPGSGTRMALDRDRDGALDGDERLQGTDAADPGSEPGACSDGIDNDGDGATDYPEDPGCGHASDHDESPACSNGLDDDGDGHIDHPDDSGCEGPSDATETAARHVVLDIRADGDHDRSGFRSFFSRFLPTPVKVTLLGSAEVDPSDFDRTGLRFGPSGEMTLPALNGPPGRGSIGPGLIHDADRDGQSDLVLLFPPLEGSSDPGPRRVCVTGVIRDDAFRACDTLDSRRPGCGLGFELLLVLPLLMHRRFVR
jgi:hypothetical protein